METTANETTEDTTEWTSYENGLEEYITLRAWGNYGSDED